jgi:hypothetical protein
MRKTLAGWTVLLVSLSMWMAATLRAADAPHGTTAATAATAPHSDAGHGAAHDRRPAVPESSRWPGVTIIVVLGMFLAAAIVGPVVRYHAPEEVPDATSHDEHGHGAHDAHGHDAHGH